MRENEEVIATQQRRVDMVREELARRGFPLTHGEEEEEEEGREELEQRGVEEEEVALVDGRAGGAGGAGGAGHHLPDSSRRVVDSGRRPGSGEAGSSGPGTFVGNIAAIQDGFIAAGTNEVGVVVGHTAPPPPPPPPVAEGVQGHDDGRRERTNGNAARIQELSTTPSTSAQTDRANANAHANANANANTDGVNGIYL